MNSVTFFVSEQCTANTAFSAEGEYTVLCNQHGNTGYYLGNQLSVEKSMIKTVIHADAEEPYYVAEFAVPVLTEGLTYTDGSFIGLEVNINDDVDGDNVRDAFCSWLNLGAYWDTPAAIANVQLVKELPAAE